MLHRCRHNPRCASGFSLIELLIVIAVVVVIAAILFPVFAVAREKARADSCLSNEKQMGIALQLYTTDNDGGMPTWDSFYINMPLEGICGGDYTLQTVNGKPKCVVGGTGTNLLSGYWDYQLLPYVKSGIDVAVKAPGYGGVWHCSDNPLSIDTHRSYGMSQGVFYDSNHNDIDGYRWLNESKLARPASCIFVGDSGKDGRLLRNWLYSPGYSGYYTNFVNPSRKNREDEEPWRHNGQGANYVFCDGHAKYMLGNTLYPHPGASASGVYPTSYPDAIVGQAHCAWAQYFAATQSEKDYSINQANTHGYTCSAN